MRNKINILLLSCLSLTFVGCATAPQEPQMTQLQLRELQTRNFQTTDTKMVMKAMLNVLQDDGYIVKNAVMDLGLLSASKEVDVDNRSGFSKFVMAYDAAASGRQQVYRKNMVMEASANVTEMGDRMQVRMSFQKKVLDNLGGVVEVQTITDSKYYQEFFSKVSKGVFIEAEEI